MHTFIIPVFLFLLCSFNIAIAENSYLRGALGWSWTKDTHLQDDDCMVTNPPALFGCGKGNNGRAIGAYGDFGSTALIEVAGGYQFNEYFRAEILANYRPSLAFNGEANFQGVSGKQPVDADVKSYNLMLATYLDLLSIAGNQDARFRPYIGAGIGVARNHIDKVVYRFPGLAPGDMTVSPDNSKTQSAYFLSVGIDWEISDDIKVDFSWRYSDLGEIGSARGQTRIVRTDRDLMIDVGATHADLKTYDLLLSVRKSF